MMRIILSICLLIFFYGCGPKNAGNGISSYNDSIALKSFTDEYANYKEKNKNKYDLAFLMDKWDGSTNPVVEREILSQLSSREEISEKTFEIITGYLTWGISEEKESKVKRLILKIDKDNEYKFDTPLFDKSDRQYNFLHRYNSDSAPLGFAISVGKFSFIVSIDYMSDLKNADKLYQYICKSDGLLYEMLQLVQMNNNDLRNIDVHYWFDIAGKNDENKFNVFIIDGEMSKYRLVKSIELDAFDDHDIKKVKNTILSFLPLLEKNKHSSKTFIYEFKGEKKLIKETDCVIFGSCVSPFNAENDIVYLLKPKSKDNKAIEISKANISRYFRNID